MPEFLLNSNSYHFGIKQDGVPLGDVGLPPWAKVVTMELTDLFFLLSFLIKEPFFYHTSLNFSQELNLL